MSKKILIVDGIQPENLLHIATLREKYGEDIILVTPEEALEKGLSENDFCNIPKMIIEANPIIEYPVTSFKTGQELRRERRKKERKQNK